MSAIMTSTTANEVELLADGLLYEDDGTIAARREKIYVSDRLPYAINVRGPSGVGDVLVMAARVMEGMGDVAEVLRMISRNIEDNEKFRELPSAEVTFAMVYDGQPQTWRGYTHDFGEQKAGTFWMLDDRYVGGAMGAPTEEDWAALGVVPEAPEGILRKAGIAVMERLRALPGPVYGVEDGPDVHGVGGHVQYVRLGADGSVVNEIIHSWPEDVPGQKVGAVSEAALAA